ncbi:hypothetical protein DLAC_07580 [Tieghemostelium lacteum]|uniref:Large ribosomal subunit protein uL30m n=1 Tax=Tieghemostelium lacteum TaxID=361077 RepID=A0A151ZCY5_TIELA|nr:hypothetical protein DLAC_07580 [Tieghemostelium lacteum]|eukprot:KYQ91785.1 hypothetical protein DLAC_07580 [Tieghemostelium lacteum]
MSGTTGIISKAVTEQLKRKIFRNVPHNILNKFPEHVLQSLPQPFIETLPKAPSGVIKVTLVKSSSNCRPDLKGTIEALGLHKRLHYRYHKNTPEVRGMINKAKHYVKVDEIPIE